MSVQQTTPIQFSQNEEGDKAKGKLLRRALLGNATFSAISGTLFLIEAGGVSAFTGIEPAVVFRVLGIGLLGFAAFLFWQASQKVLDLKEVKMIIGADLLWVAGSALLLMTNWLPLTSGGWWGVAIIADIVALFAVLQYVGMRRMSVRL